MKDMYVLLCWAPRCCMRTVRTATEAVSDCRIDTPARVIPASGAFHAAVASRSIAWLASPPRCAR